MRRGRAANLLHALRRNILPRSVQFVIFYSNVTVIIISAGVITVTVAEGSNTALVVIRMVITTILLIIMVISIILWLHTRVKCATHLWRRRRDTVARRFAQVG